MSQLRTVNNDWPYQTVKRYAELRGMNERTVRSQIARGTLPIRPKAKANEKTLINVALLERQALEQQF